MMKSLFNSIKKAFLFFVRFRYNCANYDLLKSAVEKIRCFSTALLLINSHL